MNFYISKRLNLKMSTINRIQAISKDILEKLSETKDGSNTQRFLLGKKKILDEVLEKIAKECEVNAYEYEVYNLCDKRDTLMIKIQNKERRPTEDDEDLKELKNINLDLNWARTKLERNKMLSRTSNDDRIPNSLRK
jgi:hypothetical protein